MGGHHMKGTERKLIDDAIIGKNVIVFTLEGNVFKGELTNEAPNAIWIKTKNSISIVAKSAIAVVSVKRD